MSIELWTAGEEFYRYFFPLIFKASNHQKFDGGVQEEVHEDQTVKQSSGHSQNFLFKLHVVKNKTKKIKTHGQRFPTLSRGGGVKLPVGSPMGAFSNFRLRGGLRISICRASWISVSTGFLNLAMILANHQISLVYYVYNDVLSNCLIQHRKSEEEYDRPRRSWVLLYSSEDFLCWMMPFKSTLWYYNAWLWVDFCVLRSSLSMISMFWGDYFP